MNKSIIISLCALLFCAYAGWCAPGGGGFTFQGRLQDGGSPAEGLYDLWFELYDDADPNAGNLVGSPLEAESCEIEGGYFTAYLDFGAEVFDGSARWLQVSVRAHDGTDDPNAYVALLPRQLISPVPYALYAMTGTPGPQGPAGPTLGIYDSLSLESSGGLGAGDAGGKSLYNLDNVGIGTSDPGAKLDVRGDVLIEGSVKALKLTYVAPRKHYYSVPSEAFVPGSLVDYVNSYGGGGAYINAAVAGAMVASVNLPHNALITDFKVFFRDDSVRDITASLGRLNLAAGGYSDLASVESSGITGYGSKSTADISSPVIDNTEYGYRIYAHCELWTGVNLRIMGAVISYTVVEAE